MKLFQKHPKPLPMPEGFTADSIRMESSTCTGERVIGFYDKGSNRLCFGELVRCEADIAAFYARYGLEMPIQEKSNRQE